MEHRGDKLHFLLHALGKVNNFPFRPGADLQPLQPGAPTSPSFEFRNPFQTGQEYEHVYDFHSRIKAAFLREIADHILNAAGQVLAENAQSPFIRDEDAHDYSQGGGLARAIGTQQSEQGSLPDRKTQLRDGGDGIKSLADAFGDDSV